MSARIPSAAVVLAAVALIAGVAMATPCPNAVNGQCPAGWLCCSPSSDFPSCCTPNFHCCPEDPGMCCSGDGRRVAANTSEVLLHPKAGTQLWDDNVKAKPVQKPPSQMSGGAAVGCGAECAVRVAACAAICSCDVPVCECCPECAACLGDMAEECCDCVPACHDAKKRKQLTNSQAVAEMRRPDLRGQANCKTGDTYSCPIIDQQSALQCPCGKATCCNDGTLEGPHQCCPYPETYCCVYSGLAKCCPFHDGHGVCEAGNCYDARLLNRTAVKDGN